MLPTLLLCAGALAQRPEIQLEVAAWAPWEPDHTYVEQDDSGEDWAYDLVVSHDEGDDPDGYVFTGYSTIESDYASGGDNYWSESSCVACNLTEKGCSMPKFFKTDLAGSLLWYRVLEIEGWLYSVAEISDGGFIAVGTTREREEDGHGNAIYYNPTSVGSTQTTCTTTSHRRNLFVVKIDDDGDLEWQYIYGLQGSPPATSDRDDEAFDVVEMGNGNFRIIGKASDGSDESRTTILELDDAGLLQWIEVYGTPGRMSHGRAIVRNGGDYFAVATQYPFNTSTYNHIVATRDSLGDAVAFKLNESTMPPGVSFSTTLNNPTTERHATPYDIAYSGGNLFVSAVVDCDNCFTYNSNGEGTARVYRLNPANGAVTANTGTLLGTAKAYDLWARMVPTPGGGVISLSTKQPDGPHPDCTASPDDCKYSGTHAFLAEVTSAGSDTAWTLIYDSATSMPQNYEGDKHQECLYGIVAAPNGGYTISGNNSSNYDDDYILRFDHSNAQSIDTTEAKFTQAYYFGPEDLTVGPSFVAESSFVNLVARSSITLEGPLTIQLGTIFSALVDPSHTGTIPGSSVVSSDKREVATDIVAEEDEADAAVLSIEHYPNPVSGTAYFSVVVRGTQSLRLEVVDAVGRLVATVVNERIPEGEHRFDLDVSEFSTGLYAYRLRGGTTTVHGKILVAR
jgi:hypothetical protein